MLITTLVTQWSVIVEGIFLVLSDTDAHEFPMSISFLELIDGNFAAATVLISFGALIGKVGPTQVLTLSLVEVVVYAANKRFLMMELIEIADIGGTVVIHCFGAYFGLATAWVLGAPFFRRHYAVFDRARHRIGLAEQRLHEAGTVAAAAAAAPRRADQWLAARDATSARIRAFFEGAAAQAQHSFEG